MKANKLFMDKIIILDDHGYCSPTHFAKTRLTRPQHKIFILSRYPSIALADILIYINLYRLRHYYFTCCV